MTRKPENNSASTIATKAVVTATTPTTALRQAAALMPQHGNTTILIRSELHGLHQDAANAVVSLILVIMVGFVVFMTVFFWKKYKHITLSIPTFQYSRLSQTEGEADLTEIVDQLGLSLDISSSDDEMEPATLPVSSSQYPGSNTGLPSVMHSNNVAHGQTFTEDSDEELLQ